MTVVNATVHDELQRLHLSSQSATPPAHTSQVQTYRSNYPCKEVPVGLYLQIICPSGGAEAVCTRESA